MRIAVNRFGLRRENFLAICARAAICIALRTRRIEGIGSSAAAW